MLSRLSFICILFFFMLVNLMYYNRASVFHTGSCLLSMWYMVLFSATRAWSMFSSLYVTEGTTENVQRTSEQTGGASSHVSVGCFFPLVLEFLFYKSCFFLTFLPLFRVIYKIVLSSRKEFLCFIPHGFPSGTDIFSQ